MANATHLLVGNPTAQSGRNAERIERARAWLDAHDLTCELLSTLPDGKTVAAVTKALDTTPSYRCVIAMGGDGTFREVGAGLLESRRKEDVAMGMLPTGTANDQGRSFGLEAGEEALERNLQVILTGSETRLDAGRLSRFDASGSCVSKSTFFDSAGWGISARVLAARNADRKLIEPIEALKAIYRDHMVYAGALLRVFLESYVVSDKFDVVAVLDGTRHDLSGVTDLIVKATRVYGGAWVFDPTSRHDDGMFELVPFFGKRDWTAKAIVDLEGNALTKELLDAVGLEHGAPLRASKLELRFTVPEGAARLAGQFDGEELGADAGDRIVIDVEPRALRLVIP